LGFKVYGLGFRDGVWGLGSRFKAYNLKVRGWNLGYRAKVLRIGV